MNTVASEVAALGVTKILTRRQRHLREAAVLLALIGAAVSVALGAAVLGLLTGADPAWPALAFRPPVTGPLFGPDPGHLQVPVTVALPDVAWWLAALLGLAVFIPWMRFLIGPLFRVGGNVRHRGLATAARVRRSYGARAVRRSGRFTLPGSTFGRSFRAGHQRPRHAHRPGHHPEEGR